MPESVITVESISRNSVFVSSLYDSLSPVLPTIKFAAISSTRS